ncbi:MAG: thioredoxin family protein [Sedimentisphaerales bacterium]|nr:thioredoxin family protein [Sedimentisphaerales bacterium]
MRRRYSIILAIAAAAGLFSVSVFAAEKIKGDFAEIELLFQHSPVAPGSSSAVQIKFDLEKDWHFYADKDTTPQGMSLKIRPTGTGLTFGEPVFPKPTLYFDKVTNKEVRVYSGNFSVFIPFTVGSEIGSGEIKVAISGLACSKDLCSKADYELSKKIEVSKAAKMDVPVFKEPRQSVGGANQNPTTGVGANQTKHIVLPLAVLAGLLLNVMPCVWPILPIIVTRLVQQAGQSRAKSVAFGTAFAVGIILFFVALAIVSIVLKLGFGMIFQWGDQFRNPAFVTGMALLMVVLALYMFGLFTFGLPSSVSSQSGQQSGLIGAVSMGFLAAVLSTPCSFALLTSVLIWAQTQPIVIATVTILLIGIGMALPYVVLTSIPGLLEKMPKPGKWMEHFKYAAGFILLGIGIKLLEATPAERIISVLYYAVVLSVCVWMWGGWVGYSTPKAKKVTVRLAAVVLAVVFGFVLLAGPKTELIDWQGYDTGVIESAKQMNKPVLIKFTADWCFSCKVLDKTVYSKEEVAELIKNKGVIAIKADTTQLDWPATIGLKEIYGEPSIPVTVLLLPGESEPVKLRGNMIKAKLIEHLQSLQDVKE